VQERKFFTDTLSHRPRAYSIKTSLLLSGRDGDTMMPSESSESTAASPSNFAVEPSFVWAETDKQETSVTVVAHSAIITASRKPLATPHLFINQENRK